MYILQYVGSSKVWTGTAILLLSFSSFSVRADLSSGNWYSGAKVGIVNAKKSCESHAIDCDQASTGSGLFVGYKLNNLLSIEAGYDLLGNIHAIYPALGDPSQAAPYKSETQGIYLNFKPHWQINDEWAVFGKVGTLRWNMKVTGTEIGFTHNTTDNGWSSILGTGVEYTLNNNWSTTLEYQWINNVGGSSTGGTNLSIFNLGVIYYFDF
ncbi:outer membrane beta-barrel protein [Plesiomonas sp.]|uniref:outer membrane beta-barrel protein n=1 Tax=Plesiomonas sp. TaxID=2486279 RepID=UPI003F2B044F